MKLIMKVSEIIKIVNGSLSLDTKMAIRFKLNDRKWSETAVILKKERARIMAEVEAIDSSIKILNGLKE